MRTFAEKQKTTQPTTSAKSPAVSRAHVGQHHDPNSVLNLQRTMGNQALLRSLQSNAEERNAVLTSTATLQFGHDFARIPVNPHKAGALQSSVECLYSPLELPSGLPRPWEPRRRATWRTGVLTKRWSRATVLRRQHPACPCRVLRPSRPLRPRANATWMPARSMHRPAPYRSRTRAEGSVRRSSWPRSSAPRLLRYRPESPPAVRCASTSNGIMPFTRGAAAHHTAGSPHRRPPIHGTRTETKATSGMDTAPAHIATRSRV
jgi:hypothetical protein